MRGEGCSHANTECTCDSVHRLRTISTARHPGRGEEVRTLMTVVVEVMSQPGCLRDIDFVYTTW